MWQADVATLSGGAGTSLTADGQEGTLGRYIHGNLVSWVFS
jgi:hypothetical protein